MVGMSGIGLRCEVIVRLLRGERGYYMGGVI